MFKRDSGPRCGDRQGRFNPSVGILFVQAPRADLRSEPSPCVSIPRSGFCLFKPPLHPPGPGRRRSFNPSVGILFVQAARLRTSRHACGPFQSLGRDSVCSSQAIYGFLSVSDNVSIPRSGFCLFKPTRTPPRTRSLKPVSIPRSGFCLFKPGRRVQLHIGRLGFNPSVGILFVQALAAYFFDLSKIKVSIPRSGFCLFKLGIPLGGGLDRWEFQSLGRDSVCSSSAVRSEPCMRLRFQSLGRDSVCSSSAQCG